MVSVQPYGISPGRQIKRTKFLHRPARHTVQRISLERTALYHLLSVSFTTHITGQAVLRIDISQFSPVSTDTVMRIADFHRIARQGDATLHIIAHHIKPDAVPTLRIRKIKNQHLVTAECSCPPQPGNLQRLVVESVIQVENPPPSQHFVHQHTVTGDNGRRHGIRRNGERREQEHLRQQPYSRHTQKSHRQVQKPVNRHRQVFLGLLLHHPFFLPTVPLAHPLISGPFMTPDLST